MRNSEFYGGMTNREIIPEEIPRSESSTKKGSSNKLKLHSNIINLSCLFCNEYLSKEEPKFIPKMIQSALSAKYCMSQNNYYVRGINDIMENRRTTNVIKFKDLIYYDDKTENLRRMYTHSEYTFKIKMLAEYYKFHRNVPRIFILSIDKIIGYYHFKKRRLEYIKITKMLEEQKQTQVTSSKRKSLKAFRPQNHTIADKILADLELSMDRIDSHENTEQNYRSEAKILTTNSPNGKDFENNEHNSNKGGDIFRSIMRLNENPDNTKDAVSTSKISEKSACTTIENLNKKLLEIINKSHSKDIILDYPSYLANNQPQIDNTFSNLNKFLNYIQTDNNNLNLSKINSPLQPFEFIGKSIPNGFQSTEPDSKSPVNDITKRSSLYCNNFTVQAKLSLVTSLDKGINACEKTVNLAPAMLIENPQMTLKEKKNQEIPQNYQIETNEANHATFRTIKKLKVPPITIKIKNLPETPKKAENKSPSQLNSKQVLSQREGQDLKQLSNSPRGRIGTITSRYQDNKGTELIKDIKTKKEEKKSFDTLESSLRLAIRPQRLSSEEDLNILPKKEVNGNFSPRSPDKIKREKTVSIDTKRFNKNTSVHRDSASVAGIWKLQTKAIPTRLNSNDYTIQSSSLTSRKSIPVFSNAQMIRKTNNRASLNQLGGVTKNLKSPEISSPQIWSGPQSGNEIDHYNLGTLHIIPENGSFNLDLYPEKYSSKIQSPTNPSPNSQKSLKNSQRPCRLDFVSSIKKDSLLIGNTLSIPATTREIRSSRSIVDLVNRPVLTQDSSDIQQNTIIYPHPHNTKLRSEPNIAIQKGVQKITLSLNDSPQIPIKSIDNKFSPQEKAVKFFNETSTGNSRGTKIALPKMAEIKPLKSKIAKIGNFPSLTDRSPLHSRIARKVQFDLMKRAAKVNGDYFEILIRSQVKH